ncbi:dienelactone hydrolase family protein [Mycolicibacterium arenosum]|uniref:Dienelactone hydrolase family protein n=1 Tax=Mycolicibacterium arenosum TaxID=2952157 RepID=A0ABT1M908_9MYCO|nr:dienelactone hydrolase family protein [Mycolicibacterium sp. CAU 1645]MCP9275360.1 dienelactone hydrolase family protein [Mycolicibacterium sp. CAU 1645]
MTQVPFDYGFGGLDFEGVICSPDDPDAPTILVFHGMEGRSDLQVRICERIVDLGYRAIAVDLFGRDVTAGGWDAGAAAMTTLIEDRDLMRDRLIGVVDILSNLPTVQRDSMAAVGFCFGGLCMLDLARHGTHLKAVASFHGLVTPLPEPPTTPIDTKVVVYHGWEDPFATPDEMLALATELTERGADWQLHAYGYAMHAFMAPFANTPERGIQYNAVIERRAWENLVDFLAETFSDVV